jgi:hypothetical protein
MMERGFTSGWWLLVFLLGIAPGNSHAHCSWGHPHHCIGDAWDGAKDLVGDIVGGTTKRAKLVWDDPAGALINPLKVIDSSIPTPQSYVEYAFKNPDEIIAGLKDPVGSGVGVPVAIAIADGRRAALQNGVRPIPEEIKALLSPYFDRNLLNSVRYTAGKSLFDGLLQSVAIHVGANAITLVNVIVFKDAAFAGNAITWSHELYHVRQYKDLGLHGFAAQYTLDQKSIERPAYQFDELFRLLQRQRLVSNSLLVGLGNYCMRAESPRQGSRVVLSNCNALDGLQQFRFGNDHLVREGISRLCLDVGGGGRKIVLLCKLGPATAATPRSFD